MKTYTNPKNGNTIKSALTFAEAREALKQIGAAKGKDADFANKLSMCGKPSEAQEFWIYSLAERFINPPKKQKIEAGNGFVKVAELFAKALENGLNRRAIRLQTEKGEEIKLTPAPDAGKNAGYIYLKVNGEYAGKISAEGDFFPVRTLANDIQDFVESFGQNTVQEARIYGQKTGNCCFCKRGLTTRASLAVGYGPDCADHYGLPWGEEVVQNSFNQKVNLGSDKRDDALTPKPDAREEYEWNRK